MCSQLEEKIEVGRVVPSRLPEGFHVYSSALTLIDRHREKQRSVFNLGLIPEHDRKLFGPSMTESDWSAVSQSVSEVPSTGELRRTLAYVSG